MAGLLQARPSPPHYRLSWLLPSTRCEAVTAMPLYDLARVIETFDKIPHCQFLGLRLSALEAGKGTAILPYDRRFVGNPRTGVVHGGVITTLLDTLSGVVVMTAVPEGTSLATLDLRIDYLHPATPGEPIRGTVECYKVTPNIAFVSGVAYHTD